MLLEASVEAECDAGDEDNRHREKPKPPPANTADGAPLAPPQFWQRRCYDFNVWSRKKRIEKLGYMHMNPVKRGLVSSPRNWLWSSYAWYEGKDDGLIRIDPV